MHLPCVFVTRMSPCSILLLTPLWGRWYSTCNFHALSLCYFFLLLMFWFSVYMYSLFFVTLFEFYIYFVSYLDKSSSGSFPQRYIACVWLHVSAAFWLFEPPAPHCFSICSTADMPLFVPSLFTCILTVLLLSYSIGREIPLKRGTLRCTVRRQPARLTYSF